MNREKNKTKNILDLFREYFLKEDLNGIESLLKGDGCFDIQDADLETKEVDKYHFITWLKDKIKSTSIVSIDIDKCLHCKIGNTVLLINNGTFPREIKDSSERSKTGLMIESTDGLISRLKFCYVFAKTDNEYVFEKNFRESQL